jgi:hypothetical protein
LRVVDWLQLLNTFPTELRVELAKVLSPESDEHLYGVMMTIYKGIERLNAIIDETVEVVKARAYEQRVNVKVYTKCCKRACSVCLGKYPYHYPFFKVNNKTLSTRRVYEFFRTLGLSEQRIHMFDRAVWARHKLISLFHGIPITLSEIGLSQIKVEVQTVDVNMRSHAHREVLKNVKERH